MGLTPTGRTPIEGWGNSRRAMRRPDRSQEMPAAHGPPEKHVYRGLGSGRAVRVRHRAAWCLPAFGHELVELRLVLGEAQPIQKTTEFLLFFLQPAQGFGAILVEGAVPAAWGRRIATGPVPPASP